MTHSIQQYPARDRHSKNSSVLEKSPSLSLEKYPFVSSNVALENPLEIGVSKGKSPMNSVFSIAMFDCRRVCVFGFVFRTMVFV